MTLKNILSLIFLLGMVGCQPQVDREYLLKNPRVLGKELSRCRADNQFDEKYCEMIKQTATTFIAFEHLQSTNPEQFGMQIMVAQQKLVALAEAIENAKDAEEKEKLEAAYQKQQQSVDMLLGVVAAMGQVE